MPTRNHLSTSANGVSHTYTHNFSIKRWTLSIFSPRKVRKRASGNHKGPSTTKFKLKFNSSRKAWCNMASNVFGSPITNSTLQGMPEYIEKNITRLDRAKVALNMKNAQNKDINARHYIENVKARWGYGVSTLCLIYNATGDPLKFVQSHNWYGHIGPAPYPVMIANGQWGAFLHVKRSGTASGSSAAVVYRGKNANGNECDWMLSWSNPWNRNHWDNSAYTDIRNAHYFETDQWGYISSRLYNSGLQHRDEWNGCVSTVITGSFTSPIFEATLTLSDAL